MDLKVKVRIKFFLRMIFKGLRLYDANFKFVFYSVWNDMFIFGKLWEILVLKEVYMKFDFEFIFLWKFKIFIYKNMI